MFKIILIACILHHSLTQNHLSLVDHPLQISVPSTHPQILPLSLARLFSFSISQSPLQESRKQYIPYSPTTTPYITFTPTSLQLTQKYRIALPSETQSLLQDLRSPYSFEYESIIVLRQCIIVLKAPNKLILIEKPQSIQPITDYFLYVAATKYSIKQISLLGSSPQLHHITEDYALGFYFDTGIIFLVNKTGLFPSQVTITGLAWVQSLNNNEFITAQGTAGLGHYSLIDGQITLIAKYSDLSLSATLDITDFSVLSFTHSILHIFILCETLGVVEVSIDTSARAVAMRKTIMVAKGCNAVDSYTSKDQTHLIVSCMVNEGNTYNIYEMTITGNRTQASLPYYHRGEVRDITIGDKYFFTDEDDSISVFWGESHGEKKGYHVQPITLSGLQCFKKHRDILFVVRDKQLILYRMSVLPYTLKGNSTVSGLKQFTLRAQIQCSEYTAKIIREQRLCLYERAFELSFHGGSGRLISVAVSVTLISLSLILLYLCLTKYLSMERTARKSLDIIMKKEKKKREYQFNL